MPRDWKKDNVTCHGCGTRIPYEQLVEATSIRIPARKTKVCPTCAEHYEDVEVRRARAAAGRTKVGRDADTIYEQESRGIDTSVCDHALGLPIGEPGAYPLVKRCGGCGQAVTKPSRDEAWRPVESAKDLYEGSGLWRDYETSS